MPAAAVGRAVAAEALCRETSRALRAARAAPAAPGRSPARPLPSPRGFSPSRARPLSPTKAGRHSPSAPRAAPSSSEPSSSTARSILGAEGEEPPPARPRSSAPLGAAARPAPALPSPVNKRRAALPPPPRSCRRVLTLPPPAPRRGRGGCRGAGLGAGLGAAANLLPQRVLCPGTEHGDGCSVPRGSLAQEELRVSGLVSYSRRKSLRRGDFPHGTTLELLPVAGKVFIFRDLKLLSPIENYHEGLNPAVLTLPLSFLSSEETLWGVHTATEAVHLHLKGVYVLASANPLLFIYSMYLL